MNGVDNSGGESASLGIPTPIHLLYLKISLKVQKNAEKGEMRATVRNSDQAMEDLKKKKKRGE